MELSSFEITQASTAYQLPVASWTPFDITAGMMTSAMFNPAIVTPAGLFLKMVRGRRKF